MKKIIPVVLLFICSAMVVVLLLLSAAIPESSLWNGYIILYVSAECSETDVLATLDKNNIDDIISFSTQRTPFISRFAPVQPESRSPEQYLAGRLNFFYDKSGMYRLYYVPEKYAFRLPGVMQQLQNCFPQCDAGWDAAVSYNWVVPVVCGLVFIMFLFLTANRWFMFVAGILPVLFSICLPSFTNGAAIVVLLFGLLLIAPVWGRKRMLPVILKSATSMCFVCLPLLIAAAGSLNYGLVLLIVYAGTGCLLKVLHFFQIYLSGKHHFVPVMIRSAEMIPVITGNTRRAVYIPVIAIGLFIVFFLFSGIFLPSFDTKDLFLPAPAEYTYKTDFSADAYTAAVTEHSPLPGLADFVSWVWNISSFPFRSVYEMQGMQTAVIGDNVQMPEYFVDSATGKIHETLNTVLVFDELFIESVLMNDITDTGQIEFMLKKQNSFVPVDYIETGNGKTSNTNRIMIGSGLIVALLSLITAGFLLWRLYK